MTRETESNIALRWTNLNNAERKETAEREMEIKTRRSCRKSKGQTKRKDGNPDRYT